MPGEELLCAQTQPVHIFPAILQIMGPTETMTLRYLTQMHPAVSIWT